MKLAQFEVLLGVADLDHALAESQLSSDANVIVGQSGLDGFERQICLAFKSENY
jgi:hypothetical protein